MHGVGLGQDMVKVVVGISNRLSLGIGPGEEIAVFCYRKG